MYVHFIKWIKLNHDHFKAMTLTEFMALIYKTHLPAHWQDNTCIALSQMTQDLKSFCEFQITV